MSKEDSSVTSVAGISPKDVAGMIEQAGGEVTGGAVFEDGHAFMTASFPLPKTHWLYEDKLYESPPMPFRIGTINSEERQKWEENIIKAAKYAIKASTMNGEIIDFDPDAMVRNMVVGMLGYYTPDGLSTTDDWCNPSPINSKEK